MRPTLAAILSVALAATILFLAPACESIFPKCDDASKPCPPVEPYFPPDPDDLRVSCSAACANLLRLGCPEGHGSLGGEPCSVTCYRSSTTLRSLPLTCWTDAGDAAAARSCGSLRCLR